MLGLLALGHRMAFALEDPVTVIQNHLEHLLGGGNVLFPLAGGEDPEDKKDESHQPGESDGVVHLHRRVEAQEGKGTMHFESGDQEHEDQGHLEPVPEPLITGVKVHVDLVAGRHGYFSSFLPLVKMRIRP
ncbi:hypothetical protein DESC_660058 [Desulfosarcina cetonica]|nr:hypothetical protein DESC_660058 [Desulfosarcina cetonica]